ncbi:Hypothetical predicted protein [Prunus dulcis]|uniref:Uncharacterized protein n=1 Tax=Prunus dulcis TaxID=3755 RepID=A0A5E4G150_PRUDU|nr:Hypothetical predicted protein [Prunus dulcis]
MESTSMEPQKGSAIFGDQNGTLTRLGRFKERWAELSKKKERALEVFQEIMEEREGWSKLRRKGVVTGEVSCDLGGWVRMLCRWLTWEGEKEGDWQGWDDDDDQD